MERRAGDLQVAKAYYLGLDQSWSWWDTVFRPRVYRALAEIAVQEERPQDDIEYYSRLLELWRDVDPVLYPERSEVQEALAALLES